jgi:hypothetical protein
MTDGARNAFEQGDHKDMKLLDIASLPKANKSGLNSDGTVQLWTHKEQSDCMFIAFLKKG